MTNVRNQLKSQDLSTLEAASLETVGGRIFPDNTAVPDLRALVEVLDSYRAVHLPTYGQPIPGTSDAQTVTADDPNTFKVLIAPTGDTVTRVQVINIINNGSIPAQIDIALIDANGAAFVAAVLDVAAGARVNGINLANNDLFIDRNTSLEFRVVAGDHLNVSVRTYSINVVN